MGGKKWRVRGNVRSGGKETGKGCWRKSAVGKRVVEGSEKQSGSWKHVVRG